MTTNSVAKNSEYKSKQPSVPSLPQQANSFCPLPWNHLASYPNGYVGLCCESDPLLGRARTECDNHNSALNLNSNSISEIINSNFFKQVRLEMLANKKPKACSTCFKNEVNGVQSKRMRELENFTLNFSQAQKNTQSDGSIQANPEFLELRLGNICNLKCRSCAPHSSTKWASDYQKLAQQVDFLPKINSKQEYSWPRKKSFWQDLAQYTNQLKTIYINGGEPMLNREHWHFLESLIESKQSKQISIEYSCNMTSFPKEVFCLWKHFKNIVIRASIDDLGQRNHYIRYPSDWKVIEGNLELLKQQGIDTLIVQTISAYNLNYLAEFQKWCDHKNLHLSHNYVERPDFLSPLAIPQKPRQEIIEQLENKLRPDLYKNLYSKFYTQNTNNKLLAQFMSYTKELDLLRSENFAHIFPELSKCLSTHSH